MCETWDPRMLIPLRAKEEAYVGIAEGVVCREAHP